MVTDQDLARRIDAVIGAYTRNHPDEVAAPARIRAAYTLAAAAHTGQLRATGEPYIIHPLAVAQTVADLGMDAEVVIAALCHDVVEDTPIDHDTLCEAIGAGAATLVDGVTKLSTVTAATREHTEAANLRKLLLAATADPRVLVLKIADRLHNASTLAPLPEKKRTRVATETLEVYAPIAHRLGMNETAAALEDAAFAALQPELYREISARMDAVAPARDTKLDRIKIAAAAALDAAGVTATVTGRHKHVYSTWRKTVVRKQDFDAIADLVGIRVIVDDVPSCYATLGILHNEFTPVPGRFRDYIAQPRFGHYQSLHTTVAVDGIVTEVQIRTWAMHANAEQGIAAHWRYKVQQDPDTPTTNHQRPAIANGDAGAAPVRPTAPDLPWLHQLLASGFVAQSTPEEFLAGVRADLGADEVVVFTPDGEPIALPEGATVLDAAYAVHTEIGNHCREARINGTVVPRSTRLRPGDQFAITTDEDTVPAAEWAGEVITGRAKHALTVALNTRHRHETRLAATDALNAAVRRAGLSRGWVRAVSVAQVAPLLGYTTTEALLDAYETRPELADATARKIRERLAAGHTNHTLVDQVDVAAGVPSGTPVVAGHDGLVVAAAPCCGIDPGTEAVGVPEETGEIVAHAVDCLALAHTSGPMYDITYAPTRPVHSASILVHALHRRHLIVDVATAAETAGGAIIDLTCHTADHATTLTLTAAAADPDTLWRLVDQVRGVDGVYKVTQTRTP